MFRYWKAHPPTHVLVAAYLGYESKDDGNDMGMKVGNEEQIKEHLKQVMAGSVPPQEVNLGALASMIGPQARVKE